MLIHSGLMEVPDRDPTAFFEAVSAMLRHGDITSAILRVVLRATGRDEEYRRQIAALGIGDIVAVEGRVSHSEAVAEMRRADGLLLFQGAQCNRHIREGVRYLACRRPIIGLIDSGGDTHALIVRQWQVPYVADMQSAPAIAGVLRKFIADCRRNETFVPAAGLLEEHARAAGASRLAQLFDEVSSGAHA